MAAEINLVGAANMSVLTPMLARAYAGLTAQRFKCDGAWNSVSYAELGIQVEEIALGLMALGVRSADRVAIFSETRPEWTWCDLAIASAGAVSVPVYPTSSPEECAWILSDSESCVAICGSSEQAGKVAAVRNRLPKLRQIVVVEESRPAKDRMSLDELRASGKHLDADALAERAAAVTPDDLFTIVYTSGTTGPAKGCPLTHGNWRFSLDRVEPHLQAHSTDVVFLFLPLAHLLSRVVQATVFEYGAALAYFGGNMRNVMTDIAEVRPTHLPAVPHLFEKVYGQITAMAPDKRKLREAVRIGVEVRRRRECSEEISPELAQRFDEAERRLFGVARSIFGSRLHHAMSGAAPIAPEILEFFYGCGIPIYETYGMTESTGVISMNTPAATRFGTVGRPLEGVSVRIAEDGEVLARGPNVFRGYHDNDRATREVLSDGWLYTGDLGSVDAEGYLTITGRKKDVIITASGKNLTPANIENDLRQSPLISHAVMHGDRRPYPVALITLDAEEIVPWARERGLPQDIAELARNDDVRRLVHDVLEQANKKYAPPERIRRFAILDHDFSLEAGELTPTLKLKRAVIEARNSKLLDSLYSELWPTIACRGGSMGQQQFHYKERGARHHRCRERVRE